MPDTRPSPAAAIQDELAALQIEFPCFRIWHENIGGRVRYISRRLDPSLNPHTIVTKDLTELRAALEPSRYAGLIPFNPESAMTDASPADLSAVSANEAACWQAAAQIRRQHPGWVVSWVVHTREYRGYPLAGRRGAVLSAPTADELATQIERADQATTP
jgi:hypothetical protein